MTDPATATDLLARMYQCVLWLDDGLQARLHDHGWPDVSRAQSMIMLHVTSGVRRPADIARKMGVSRQAVHVTISQMIDMDMLRLDPDPDDARHKLVGLTPFGESMRKDAQASMADLLGTLTARIGEKRLDALLDAVRADWGADSSEGRAA